MLNVYHVTTYAHYLTLSYTASVIIKWGMKEPQPSPLS